MGKFGKYIIGSIITAIILFLIWYFSDIVLYVIISFVLSLLGKPLMDILSKIHFKNKRMPRWASASTVLIVIGFLFFGFFNLFIPLIYSKLQFITTIHLLDLEAYIAPPVERLNALIHNYLSSGVSFESSSIISEISQRLTVFVTNTMKNIGSVIDLVVGVFVAIFSIAFITFFFLKEDKLFKNGLLALFPVRYEDRVAQALNSSIKLLSKYFVGLILESTIKLIFITLGLYLFGMDLPTALIIALISAVLNVIPYIGPLIGAIIGILIAIATPISGELATLIVYMAILFSVFQLIDNVIIQPYIYSTSVKAHPLEIFLVILMAGSIAGVLGMLFAIPVYTILRVFAREFLNNFRLVQKLTEKI